MRACQHQLAWRACVVARQNVGHGARSATQVGRRASSRRLRLACSMRVYTRARASAPPSVHGAFFPPYLFVHTRLVEPHGVDVRVFGPPGLPARGEDCTNITCARELLVAVFLVCTRPCDHARATCTHARILLQENPARVGRCVQCKVDCGHPTRTSRACSATTMNMDRAAARVAWPAPARVRLGMRACGSAGSLARTRVGE